MKDEPHLPSRHQLDHAVPTVIHHPEEDMPLLARWVRHAMENPTRFWGMIIVVVVVVIALGIVSSGLSMGRSASDAAWTRLETAKTPSERVEIAREFPETQAGQWAILQAATEFYNQGFADLPANKDTALPALKKALDYFDEVAREAPRDSPQARAAALGAARTLEARNELDKAIKQYEKVASTWKETPEAIEAERLAKLLSKPESVAFYKELYAYKPVEATLPPMGQGTMTLPSMGQGGGGLNLPTNHPPIDGSTTFPNFGSPLMIPPPPPSSPSPTPKDEPAPGPGAGTLQDKDTPLPGLPADPFARENTTPKPQAEPSKNELPTDPFAPKPKD